MISLTPWKNPLYLGLASDWSWMNLTLKDKKGIQWSSLNHFLCLFPFFFFDVNVSTGGSCEFILKSNKSNEKSNRLLPWLFPWGTPQKQPPSLQHRARTAGFCCCPADRSRPLHGYLGTQKPQTWGGGESQKGIMGKFNTGLLKPPSLRKFNPPPAFLGVSLVVKHFALKSLHNSILCLCSWDDTHIHCWCVTLSIIQREVNSKRVIQVKRSF